MTISIKEQYEMLAHLMKADRKILRYERGLSEIPKEITRLKKELLEQRSDFDSAQSSLGAAKKQQRVVESSLKERETNLEKAESKLMEVKTNAEYQAAMKENEEQKIKKSQLEDDVLALLNDVETLHVKAKEKEAQFKTVEKAFAEQNRLLEEELVKLEKMLGEESKKREVYLSKLSPPILVLYKRVYSTNLASPVAAVENGLCQGCRIRLRPQLHNEILGFQKIHKCPNCGRILITLSGDEPSETDQLFVK